MKVSCYAELVNPYKSQLLVNMQSFHCMLLTIQYKLRTIQIILSDAPTIHM